MPSDWSANAACAGQDPAMWFGTADKRGALSPRQRAAKQHAIQTCATCPVRAECAEAGRDEPYGIWGGLTPAQRGWRHNYRRSAA